MDEPVEIIPESRALARVPRPWIRFAALIIAALAWWVCIDLTRESFGSGASSPLMEALCAGGAADGGADCQSVLRSSYGSIPISPSTDALRIPVAALGAGYFAFVAFWYLLIGPPTLARRPWHFVIVAVVLLGLLSSLDYMRIMYAELHRWCLGCMAVHALNAVIAILTVAAFPWRAERVAHEPHPRGRLVIATFAAGAFLFLLHVVIAFVFVQNSSLGRIADGLRRIVQDDEYIRWDYARQPQRDLTVDSSRPSLGDAGAPHTVVVFLDFQCPRCREASATLENVVARLPDRVRVVSRHYPLNSECNPHVPGVKHASACAAARAAEAVFVAGGDGAFQAMKRLLYERQAALDGADFAAWAAESGVDAEAWRRALDSETVTHAIEGDVALAHLVGVDGAPIVFLDGRRLSQWSKLEIWDALLADDGITPSATGPSRDSDNP